MITKEVNIVLNPANMKHYKGKGYENLKAGETISVATSDLTKSSKVIVEVECEYCHKHVETQYFLYYKSIQNNGKYCCKKCKHIKQTELLREKVKDNPNYFNEVFQKQKQTMLERYGVEHCMHVESIKQKQKDTCLKNYGVDNPAKSKEVYEKIRRTNLERYNVETPTQNKEIFQKCRETMKRKYGVEYAFYTDEAIQKLKEVNMVKYGVENPFQSKEFQDSLKEMWMKKYGESNLFKVDSIRKKAYETMNKNSTAPSSSQQKYICQLYNGKLNYLCGYYRLDVFLDEHNIDFEYDGKGHNLSVTLGNITENEFKTKEIIRDKYIKSHDIKIARIICKHDKIPCDDILLKMKDIAVEYFTKTNHTWIEFHVDDNLIKNADNKSGFFFNYGDLHKVNNKIVKEVA